MGASAAFRRQGRGDRGPGPARRDHARLRASTATTARRIPQYRPLRITDAGSRRSARTSASMSRRRMCGVVEDAFLAEYAESPAWALRHARGGIRSRHGAGRAKLLRFEIRNARRRSSAAGVDQDAREDGARVHGAALAREERRPTPSARRQAARTSTSAGRTGGDVPHRRLAVHPAVRLCQIDTGKPTDYDTTSRAESPRAWCDTAATRPSPMSRVDDLPDGGAWLDAETVRRIHAENPNTGVEILATDFNGDPALLREVFDSRPEVFAHNVETVPRIFRRIRPTFRYDRSLGVLTMAREAGLITSRPHPRHGREAARGRPGTPGPPRCRHRHHHDHAVPAYLPRHLPVDRWVKPARVRRGQGRGRTDRLPRRPRGSARALVPAPVASGRSPCCPRPSTSRRLSHLARTSPSRSGHVRRPCRPLRRPRVRPPRSPPTCTTATVRDRRCRLQSRCPDAGSR